MTFASKTPRDLACTCYWTDPSTWFAHYGAVEPGSQMEPNYECFEHFPHEQHNEPNPILVSLRAFRQAAAFLADPRGLYASWNFTFNHAKVPDSALVAFLHPGASVAHLAHARRVLERLARLASQPGTEGAPA